MILGAIVKVAVRQGLTKTSEKLNVGDIATLFGERAVTVMVYVPARLRSLLCTVNVRVD